MVEFLWWCLCGGVCVVVILWWCLCGGVFVVVFVWWCFAFLWWCLCGVFVVVFESSQHIVRVIRTKVQSIKVVTNHSIGTCSVDLYILYLFETSGTASCGTTGRMYQHVFHNIVRFFSKLIKIFAQTRRPWHQLHTTNPNLRFMLVDTHFCLHIVDTGGF